MYFQKKSCRIARSRAAGGTTGRRGSSLRNNEDNEEELRTREETSQTGHRSYNQKQKPLSPRERKKGYWQEGNKMLLSEI